MALCKVFAVLLVCVIGVSFFGEASAAWCKKKATCSVIRSSTVRTSYKCGWWTCHGRRTYYRIAYQSCTKLEACGHCEWSDWTVSHTGTCNKKCGGGIQKVTERRSHKRSAFNGGNPCTGGNTRTYTQACNTHHCPIHGGWSQYSDFTHWSECSGKCDHSRERERTCTEPEPKYGGNDCVGIAVERETRYCYEGKCLVEACKKRKNVDTEFHASLPHNCMQYVSCDHTNRVMNCSEGTLWNQEKFTCVHKKDAHAACRDEPEDESEQCEAGDFRTHENESAFEICDSNQQWIKMQCAQGLVFDPNLEVCNWP